MAVPTLMPPAKHALRFIISGDSASSQVRLHSKSISAEKHPWYRRSGDGPRPGKVTAVDNHNSQDEETV